LICYDVAGNVIKTQERAGEFGAASERGLPSRSLSAGIAGLDT